MSLSRRLRALTFVGLFSLVLVGTIPAQAPNVLANPGFEGGAWLGWGIFGNTFVETINAPEIDPHTGQYLAKIFGGFWGSGVFNVSGIFQAFSTNPGESWEMDSWSRHWSGDPLTGAGAPSSNWCLQRIAFFDNTQTEITAAGVESLILDGTFASDMWHYNAPIKAVAPQGAVQVQALILFLQPSLDTGALQVDDVSFRRAWDIQMVQDPSNLNVTVSALNGNSLAQWAAFYSADPQNGTMPGQGPLGGFWIPFNDLNLQLQLALAAVPPFGGFLDASGSSANTIPGMFFAPLSGQTLYGMAIQITNAGTLDYSVVEAITFL